MSPHNNSRTITTVLDVTLPVLGLKYPFPILLISLEVGGLISTCSCFKRGAVNVEGWALNPRLFFYLQGQCHPLLCAHLSTVPITIGALDPHPSSFLFLWKFPSINPYDDADGWLRLNSAPGTSQKTSRFLRHKVCFQELPCTKVLANRGICIHHFFPKPSEVRGSPFHR